MSNFEHRKELGLAARKAIGRASQEVFTLGRDIYASPEGPGAEHHALEAMTGLLDRYGFHVETGVAGLPTAFHARIDHWNSEDMRKGLRHGHVAFLAEYHADPEQGHLDGNHLVAAGAIAAAIGLAETFSEMYGTVSIFGAPDGERGKAIMADVGLFKEPDCLIVIRPAPSGEGFQATIRNTGETLAEQRLTFHFGESEAGLDALRTAIPELVDDVVGDATIKFDDDGLTVQATRAATVEAVVERIVSMMNMRAGKSGQSVEIERGLLLRDTQVSRILARRIKTFADTLKYQQDRIQKSPPGPPSGLGNISYFLPAVEARYPVESHGHPKGTIEFRDASNTDEAYQRMLSLAKCAALAGLDMLGDMEFRGFAEGEFIRGMKERGISREPRRWLGVHPVLPAEKPRKPRLPIDDVIVRGPGIPPPRIDDES